MAEDLESKLIVSAEKIIKDREDLRRELFKTKDLLVEEFERRKLRWYHIFYYNPIETIHGSNLLSLKEEKNLERKNWGLADRVASRYKRYPTVNMVDLVAHYPLNPNIGQAKFEDLSKSVLILSQLYSLSAERRKLPDLSDDQIKGEIKAYGSVVQFGGKRYRIGLYDDFMAKWRAAYSVKLFENAPEDLLSEVASHTHTKFEFVIEPIELSSTAALQDGGKFLKDLGYTKERFDIHAATLREVLQYLCNIGAKVDGYTPTNQKIK